MNVLISTNNGAFWTNASDGLGNDAGNNVACFAASGVNLFAATIGGVYLTTNSGTKWTAINEGMPQTLFGITGLVATYTDVYALRWGDSSVWRRSISDFTSVQQLPSAAPVHFNLSQNYPNPFNPSTTIEFSVPQAALVTLRVFNVLGSVVGTLVNEELQAGSYRTTWEASGFSSGVYFYRMEAGWFVETKKLMLLR
jgi:hypothetical protein